MNKTMKKIASIGVATTMVAATLTGAMAADLKDLPAPFIKDGVADFSIVIGNNAAPSDVIGAIDIATAMQASSVSQEAVEVAGSASSSVSDGVKVETSGNALLLGETLQSVESRFDKNDMPELLADGVVTEEDDNEDYDYDQELTLGGDITVQFDADDSDMDDPVLYLDLDTSADALWNYTVDFTGGDLDLVALDDSESIVMLGKTFTFDPNTAQTGEIKLFGSDRTDLLNLNEPKTFTIEGKSYTVEVVGGNSDNDNVIIAVNGVQKTLSEGDTQTINGLEIYAKDVFVTNIPTLSAAATVFIGSEEITLQGANAGTCTFSEVEISSETINGLEACVVASAGGDNNNVDYITFQFKPSELAGDISGYDEKNWLEAGEEVTDPLFGTFKVLFSGANVDMMDEDYKSMVKFTGGDDEFGVTFTNEDGDEISFTPYMLRANNSITFELAVDGEGYNGSVQNNVLDGTVFVLNEGSNPVTSHVFEVTGFTSDNSERVVRLKNLATGSTESYSNGDKVVDGFTVAVGSLDHFNLSAASSETIYLKGGENTINLNPLSSGNQENTTRYLTVNELDLDQATGATLNISLVKDSSDSEIDVSVSASGSLVDGDTDDGNDHQYYVTQYGTYVDAEIDENDYVYLWVPADEDSEVHYEVFFAASDATVSMGGSSVTRDVVNKIDVGAAVLDTNVNLATEGKNLIVVGGPCINSVAAELLGNPADCTEGFSAGKAVIELFDDLDSGNVAMLVAGYSAEDTLAATRAVALKDSRLMGKSASLTVQNAKEYTVSSN